MDRFIVIMIIGILICTHSIAYCVGKLIAIKWYGKQLDLLKKEMRIIEGMTENE